MNVGSAGDGIPFKKIVLFALFRLLWALRWIFAAVWLGFGATASGGASLLKSPGFCCDAFSGRGSQALDHRLTSCGTWLSFREIFLDQGSDLRPAVAMEFFPSEERGPRVLSYLETSFS